MSSTPTKTRKKQSPKDLGKFIEAKAAGLSTKKASELAGYSPNYNPMRSPINAMTIEEAAAIEGIHNTYILKGFKTIADTATKLVPAGNSLEEEPDFQNRNRALENLSKLMGAYAPMRTKIDVDIKIDPFAKLSDEELDDELKRLKIIDGEIISSSINEPEDWD